MSWILITNDDGIDSPALVPLVRAIGRNHQVRVVVPDRERSWIGKAITRHEPVTVASIDRSDLAMFATSGFPADCVQLGVHTLFPEPPAWVVSGINIGYNHGSSYVQSSGTVGAAMEALLAGIPAIALSAGSHSRPWPEWRAWVHTEDATGMWERLAAIAADLVDRLVTIEPPDSVVNVNLPDDAALDTTRVVTTVAQVGYEQLFRREADGSYIHDYGGGLRWFAGLEGTDVEAAAGGRVAVTPVVPAGTGTFPEPVRRLLTDRVI